MNAPARLAGGEILDHFLRGAVSAGVISAFGAKAASEPATRRIARHALQGGCAAAAGLSASNALRRQAWPEAAALLAAGAAGVALAQRFLEPETPAKELPHG